MRYDGYRIQYLIENDALGAGADLADYEQFAVAIERALRTEFPGAVLAVKLTLGRGESGDALLTRAPSWSREKAFKNAVQHVIYRVLRDSISAR